MLDEMVQSFARAHLFHTVRKHPEKDESHQKFIIGGGVHLTVLEIRRHSIALDLSVVVVVPNQHSLYAKLAIVDQGAVNRKKCKMEIRTVEKREKLIEAGKDFLDHRDDFYMVGVSFICSDVTIGPFLSNYL